MNIVLEFNNTFITSATTLLIVYMAISTIKEYIRNEKHIYCKKEDEIDTSNSLIPSEEKEEDYSAFYTPHSRSEIMQRAEKMKEELVRINKSNISNPPPLYFQHTSKTSPYLNESFTEDVEIVLKEDLTPSESVEVISDEYEKELEDMYRRVRKDEYDSE